MNQDSLKYRVGNFAVGVLECAIYWGVIYGSFQSIPENSSLIPTSVIAEMYLGAFLISDGIVRMVSNKNSFEINNENKNLESKV